MSLTRRLAVAAVAALSCLSGTALAELHRHPILPSPPPFTTNTPPAAAVPADAVTAGGDARLDLRTMARIPAGWVDVSKPPFADVTAGRHRALRKIWVRSFVVDRKPVSVRAYRHCVDSGHCSEPATAGGCSWATADAGGADPVNCVNWHQANAYCRYRDARLIDELQWERAGDLVARESCPHGLCNENAAMWEWVQRPRAVCQGASSRRSQDLVEHEPEALRRAVLPADGGAIVSWPDSQRRWHEPANHQPAFATFRCARALTP
ncbi:MAG: SUMF1/EgtB/PvdO family nonheme iron enzyme [Candidatus Schekmanbacteria bacterium]|nr:SUMF1/EgtB/PvdO family nonheme iron enzyme [Candidatus Schekmanbacteria bacterium]